MKRHKRDEVLVHGLLEDMCSCHLRVALVARDAVTCASCRSFFTKSTSLFCPVLRNCVHMSQISSLNSLWKRNNLLSLPPSFLTLQRLKSFCIFPFWGETLFVHLDSRDMQVHLPWATLSIFNHSLNCKHRGSVQEGVLLSLSTLF